MLPNSKFFLKKKWEIGVNNFSTKKKTFEKILFFFPFIYLRSHRTGVNKNWHSAGSKNRTRENCSFGR